MSRKWLERLSAADYLNQGEVSAVSEYEIVRSWELHAHDFYEMELVLAGAGSQRINGESMTLSRGTFSLLSPADAHEVTLAPGSGLRLVNCKFSGALLDDELLELLLEAPGPLAVQLGEAATALLEAELARLRRETERTALARSAAMRYTLGRIVIDLLRACGRSEDGSGTAQRSAREHEVRRVLRYIHLHYREPISLAEAAAQLHLSPGYFSEKFKDWTGETFSAYVQRLRVSYADRLLSGSSLPITEIAYSAGFGSLAYFIRVYKQYRGLSPNASRKRIKGLAPDVGPVLDDEP
ncbi:AraC family transcriptional regulator [Cohnella rhizosphaerae]|uniref:AraC family transcriptional regulator n=1 Tax=Cohnella rhizosphaerae TaxID=1457232 RepID=A0A9X4QWJ7_9BACL|nr:AraC family transcriptional regulator [Cohnella rhizosphaerae]MDG0813734.1 AraC family transcriptional regulator [Cohnella rhizosphaerae]